jgi:hypothetical protein
MTELGLDAEGLTYTVLHLNLGFVCFDVFWFLGFFVCLFCFFPFDETMAELLPQTPTPGLEDEGLTKL